MHGHQFWAVINLWRACGICMTLVEVDRLALVTHVWHKRDLILEVISAVVKHRSAERHYDDLRHIPRIRPAVATLRPCILVTQGATRSRSPGIIAI